MTSGRSGGPTTVSEQEVSLLTMAVIAADGACMEIATRYARHYPSRRVKPIEELDDAEDAHGVFVIAQPSTFRRQFLNRLVGARRRGAVGVACARTPVQLRAFLELQLRAPKVAPAGRRAGLLDELYDRSLYYAGDDIDIEPYPETPILPLLRTHDLLGMHVHGEGAHANLRHLVLCGQSGDSDSHDGCTPGTCRREGRSREGMSSFASVQADTLMFLSCSGFSVSGEHYPSTNSAVLSVVAGGRVRNMLCNDRTVPLSPADVELAFRIAVQHGPTASQRFLNDVAVKSAGVRPWLLVGDPAAAGRGSGDPLVVSESEVTHPARGRRIVTLRDSRCAAVATDGALMIGARTAKLVDDVTEPLMRSHAVLGKIGNFCTAVDLLTDVLLCERDSPALKRLRDATVTVRQQAYRLRTAISSACDCGFADGDTVNYVARADRLADLYGRRVAQALLPTLDDHLEEAVLALGVLRQTEAAAVCDRCGHGLTARTGTGWASTDTTISARTCITCGPRRVTLGADPHMQTIASTVWDQRVPLVGVEADRDGYWMAVSLKDKATGENLLRLGPLRPKAVASEQLRCQAAIHPSPDLHTVRLLTVAMDGLSIDRFRVAASPSAVWPA